MTTFKRKIRLPFASDKEVKQFVEDRLDAWEANERTAEEVHERCEAMMAAAANGEELLPGKAVFAKGLGKLLKEYGCFLEGSQDTKKTASKFD